MFKDFILPSLITIVLITLFVIFSYKLTKEKSNKAKMIPIIILWGLMVILEFWKISYLIAKDLNFYPNRYPIVFCSLVMFTIPVFAFKENKFSNIAKLFTIFTSIGAVIAFFATAWTNKMSLMQGHSYFYHGSMLAIAIYMLTIKTYKYSFSDFYKLFLMVALYIVFNSILGMYINTYISLFGPTSSYTGVVHNIFGFLPGNALIIVVLLGLCLGVFCIIDKCYKHSKTKKGE